jgi:hypothetical protein
MRGRRISQSNWRYFKPVKSLTVKQRMKSESSSWFSTRYPLLSHLSISHWILPSHKMHFHAHFLIMIHSSKVKRYTWRIIVRHDSRATSGSRIFFNFEARGRNTFPSLSKNEVLKLTATLFVSRKWRSRHSTIITFLKFKRSANRRMIFF